MEKLMENITYYKIRSKSNPGMYVRGTPAYHSFDKIGRIFQKIGALRSFITQVMNSHYIKADITDWEVVELQMVITSTKDLHEMLSAKKIKELLTK
jgi:hypothetical protein